jgi:hypothetical protein
MNEPQEADYSVVKRDESLVAPLAGMITEAMVSHAEKAVAQVVKIKKIAMSVTSKTDWQNLGGKMYLSASGTQKVAALFGVSFKEPKIERSEDLVDGEQVITFYATITAIFGGREVPMEGVSSTRDKFFSMKQGKRIPLGEIDLPSVRKKALTNAYQRATKDILGIGNVDPGEVANGCVSVTYGAPKPRPAPRPAPPQPKVPEPLRESARGAPEHLQAKPIEGGVEMHVDQASANPEPIAPPHSDDPGDVTDEIWDGCMKLADGDEVDACARLEQFTMWVDNKGEEHPGTRDLNRIRAWKPFARKKLVDKVREALGKLSEVETTYGN